MEEITIKIITSNNIDKVIAPFVTDSKTNQNYQSYIEDLNYNIRKKHYRRVLYEIENSTKKFASLPIYCNKLVELKSKCILKIIAKKLRRYAIESKDKDKDKCQKLRESIEFWFNQLYLIINQLTDYIIAHTEEYKSKLQEEDSMNVLEKVIEIILYSLYYLSLYSLNKHDIHEVLVYIAIGSRFNDFTSSYARNPKTLHLYQNLMLIHINLLLANNEPENALQSLDQVIKLSFKQFFLMINLKEHLTQERLDNQNEYKELLYHNIIHLVISLFQRGVLFEKAGKILKAIESYNEILLISKHCLIDKYPHLNDFLSKVKLRSVTYNSIINDISRRFKEIKDEQKKREYSSMNIELFNHNKERSQSISNGTMKTKSLNLNKTLNKISQIDLNDDSVSSKTKTLTSTVRLIDNLMSKDFQPFVIKMNKIEVNNIDKDTLFQIQKHIKDLNKKKEAREPKMNQMHQCKYPQSLSSSKPISLKYHPNKVKKLKSDGKTFRNSYLQKKHYLEKYSQKELTFHKKLLTLKKYERETSTLRFSPSNIQGQAEDFFSSKMSLFKSNRTTSTIHKLIVKKIAEAKSGPKISKSMSCSSILHKLKHPYIYKGIDSSYTEYENITKLNDNKIYDYKEANEHNLSVLEQITNDYNKINYLKKHIEEKRTQMKKKLLNKTPIN